MTDDMNETLNDSTNETAGETGKPMSLAESWKLNWRIWRVSWHIWPMRFVSATLSTLFEAATPLVTVWFSAQIINELASGRDPGTLMHWIVLTLAVSSTVALIGAGLRHWQEAEDYAAWMTCSRSLFTDTLLGMDYEVIDDPKISDLSAQIQASSNFGGKGTNNALDTFQRAMRAIFQIIGGAGLTVSLFSAGVPAAGARLVHADWLLALNNPWTVPAVIATLVLAAAAAAVCAAHSEGFWAKLDALGRFGNRVFAFFSFEMPQSPKRAADLRMYHQYERVAVPFDNNNRTFNSGDTMERMARGPMGLWMAASEAIAAGLTGLAYLFVCLKAWGGAFGVGSVTQYIGAITSVFLGVSELLQAVGSVRNNGPFLAHVFELLDMPNHMYRGTLTTEKRNDRQYEVEFRDVSFRYPGAGEDQWALQHVNLRFRVGSRLAVVGPNGSGKTTFIKLLCRLYDPTEGEILLNGIDIRKYRYDEYIRIFSVVFQDFQLLALPLGQNIAGGTDVDRARAEDCLRKADFGERLDSLPHGLDTSLYRELDDEGVQISGGEAQKIAIARALYRDAPFIILDEPTAALDPIAEAQIYAKFNDIAGDKTAVYISHRLSSCKFCDDIAVFDNGHIVQFGTHAALVADEAGLYHRLWHAQAQYYAEK